MQFRSPIIGAVLILAGCIATASAKSDTTFLTDAIQINLAEISVGDLAQKNGGSDDVKSFGKMQLAPTRDSLTPIKSGDRARVLPCSGL